jgi:uncharacterized protein
MPLFCFVLRGEKMIVLFLVVSFISTTVGAISGIGGGIIIKPVLDSFGILEVSTIGFMSGCTVLAMASTNLVINLKNKVVYEKKLVLFLAIGSSLGGFLGSQLLEVIKNRVESNNGIGLIQTVILLAINLGIVIFLVQKDRVTTLNITSSLLIMLVGLSLGVISSFLGIGGGPINIAVLFYFFSLNQGDSARSSLVIIFFAQAINLIAVVIFGQIPSVNFTHLVVMILGGVVGGMFGTKISLSMTENHRTALFRVVLLVVIFINFYNLYRFGQGVAF